MDFYPLAKQLLFAMQPERAHYFSMRILERWPSLTKLMNGRLSDEDERLLETRVAGITFQNPVGLAAGFDKNGKWLQQASDWGFGFTEIGTITPKAQAGNPQPRLFRLVADKALVNRMGFNNEGADAVHANVSKYINQCLRKGQHPITTGINIGKNKNTPNKKALDDYRTCAQKLYDVADYMVINVSSPNTPGLRDLQTVAALEPIFNEVLNVLLSKPVQRPLFVKIAPDLNDNDILELVALAKKCGLAGVVANNTTTSREGLDTPGKRLEAIGAGGLSGAPLTDRSQQVAKAIGRNIRDSDMAFIASGGIMTPKDAHKRFLAGAHLVQLYTGFIYSGPRLVADIKKNCLKKLDREPVAV